jgi:glycosyltransferase involved in cell wall biosynthesis
MRIGMILDKTFPPDPRVENEAISLVENGFEVYLFCLKYDNGQSEDEVINGINVKRYQSNTLEYKLSALAYTFPSYTYIMSKKINNFLINNTIEVIHIHDIGIAEAVFKVNKELKLPVVLDLHENRPEIMKSYPHLLKFPGKYLISLKKWKLKEEEFIKKADKTIVVTQEAKDEIKNRTDLDGNQIIVVPNTVKKSFYSEIILNKSIIDKYKDKFVILYLGDTGLRRGLLTAIEAVKQLKQEIKNLKLVIVGSNTSDSILKKQVKNYNLEKYIDFEGWQNVDLFPSYITASEIGISPLHRNIHHDTTYANKLFQYMSFAKPVLVSNATAQKNLIEKTKSGLVHIEKDSKDFAKKTMQLFADETLRNELGVKGKKFIEEEFCWEKTSKKLIQIYQELSN